ncbi:hypothetical protein BDW22DRAFT_1486931 [Trametopsis cervina]|nr:hypothetical protein BDW22DRAFT_1486931 [Trametopsis cervina]
MAHIGSVFLGDVQRQRIFSTSTPPSSPPPPHISPSNHQGFPDMIPEDLAESSKGEDTSAGAADPVPAKVTPQIAFELRTRLLETIVLGTQQNIRHPRADAKSVPLAREIEGVQKKLDSTVQSSGSDSLRWFVDNYDQYKNYLTPAFALSGVLPPTPSAPLYSHMSPSELDAYLSEMDPDIRAADRDLREIEMLTAKEVGGAGRLGEYRERGLEGRLGELVREREEMGRKWREVEERVARVVNSYATTTDALSELFVAWDDTLSDAEGHVAKLQREREERRRLGLA